MNPSTDVERDEFLATLKQKIVEGGITEPELGAIRLYAFMKFDVPFPLVEHSSARIDSLPPQFQARNDQRLREAELWIRTALQSGPRSARSLVREAREQSNVTERELREAAKNLKVKIFKGAQGWMWEVPSQITVEK